MIRRFIFAAIAGSLVLGVSACNTVAGAGKDLQSASESTKEAINK